MEAKYAQLSVFSEPGHSLVSDGETKSLGRRHIFDHSRFDLQRSLLDRSVP